VIALPILSLAQPPAADDRRLRRMLGPGGAWRLRTAYREGPKRLQLVSDLSSRGGGRFQNEYGIHVNYDVLDSTEISRPRVLTGHTNDDLSCRGRLSSARSQADIYRSFDKSCCRISRHVDPEVATRRAL